MLVGVAIGTRVLLPVFDSCQSAKSHHNAAVMSAGVVWWTIVGFGSNFDMSGLLEYVAISWPSSASSNCWTQVAAHEDFLANDLKAAQQLFRTNGGERWAPLQDMKEANKYFGEIKGTGVLGLFPFNQPLQGMPQPAIQVSTTQPV